MVLCMEPSALTVWTEAGIRGGEMSRVAKWANEPASKTLFEAQPVKGDLGILLHETALQSYLTRDTSGGHWYPGAQGRLPGIYHNNLQADWVHPTTWMNMRCSTSLIQ